MIEADFPSTLPAFLDRFGDEGQCREKCALTVRNGHGAEFLIAQSARSRADHGLS